MQSEVAQPAIAGPGFGGRDECPPDAAPDRVRGDCQLADVSVNLTGEMALLADGDHSCDTALTRGDQDYSLVAGRLSEGVGEPLPGRQDGGLVIPPGGNSLGQPRGELDYGILVTLGRGANLDACTIHVSSMSREPSYKKVYSGNRLRPPFAGWTYLFTEATNVACWKLSYGLIRGNTATLFAALHPPGHPPRDLHVRDGATTAIGRFIDGYNERCEPFACDISGL